MRYERGVDDQLREVVSSAPTWPPRSSPRCPGGTVRPGVVDVWLEQPEPPDLELIFRVPRFVRHDGRRHSRATTSTTSSCRLGCAGEADADDACRALRDGHRRFRPDLEREIDLYEEVLRLWGMDRIPADAARRPRARCGARTPEQEHVSDVIHRHPARHRPQRDHDLLLRRARRPRPPAPAPPRGWAWPVELSEPAERGPCRSCARPSFPGLMR